MTHKVWCEICYQAQQAAPYVPLPHENPQGRQFPQALQAVP